MMTMSNIIKRMKVVLDDARDIVDEGGDAGGI